MNTGFAAGAQWAGQTFSGSGLSASPRPGMNNNADTQLTLADGSTILLKGGSPT